MLLTSQEIDELCEGDNVPLARRTMDSVLRELQRAINVLEDDTPDSLAARVFEQECEAYPEAIRLFAEGRLRIEGRRVRILKSS